MYGREFMEQWRARPKQSEVVPGPAQAPEAVPQHSERSMAPGESDASHPSAVPSEPIATQPPATEFLPPQVVPVQPAAAELLPDQPLRAELVPGPVPTSLSQQGAQSFTPPTSAGKEVAKPPER